MSDTSNIDLTARLKRWFEESGYPLEMRVAAAFQRAEFNIFQSDFYADPDTGEQREIDVLATRMHKIGDIYIRLNFFIECKKSTSNPWVLFLAPKYRLSDKAAIVQRAASDLGRNLLRALSGLKEVQELPLFKITSPTAYGMSEAFSKDGNSTCFKAAMSVSKACVAEAKRANNHNLQLSSIFNIYIPVIVIDGSLFEVVLDEGNSESIFTETKEGLLTWRNPVVGMPHTLIHITTESGLSEFIDKALTTCDAFFEICEKNIDKINAGLKLHKELLRFLPDSDSLGSKK